VPELPDLEYIVSHLAPRIAGRKITEVVVKEPIVIRMLLPNAGGFTDALPGRTFESLQRHGPFLHFGLSEGGGAAGGTPGGGKAALVVHCMLAGRLQIAPAVQRDRPASHAWPADGAGGANRAVKPIPHLCFSLLLDSGDWLRYGDDKKMGKVYLTPEGSFGAIPGYDTQGIDVLSPAFTRDAFEQLIKGRRHQARVFVMDQSALSAIGNAYADEILFSAGIHPKTSCASLSPAARDKLYDSIRSVLAWGIEEVRKAGQEIDVKVRDHMRVRGRKDEPCPVCGTKIRRAGVLGYDAFYCPACQPATRKQQIPW
jgi:formamidopyrimidine-DNA glycosylase